MSSDMMGNLLDIIDELGQFPMDACTVMSENKRKYFYQKFAIIYSDRDFRHSYSLLSKHLEEFSADIYSSFPLAILPIIDYGETYCQQDETQKRVCASLQKLLDHLELEGIRLDRMREVERYAKTAKDCIYKAEKEVEKVDRILQESDKSLQRTRKKVNSLQSQSVTILGIFSALVFSAVMEISVFTNSFSVLSTVSSSKVFFFLGFSGLIIFDKMFLLLYAISRIAGFSLAVDFDNASKMPRTRLVKFFQRYSYVFAFNVLLLLLCAFSKFFLPN